MKLAMVFFGMTATGKSYIARAWARKWGCLYLNSDVVRKELTGRELPSSQVAALNKGIYAPEFTRRTYDELGQRAEQALVAAQARCIVLDASYQSRRERDLIRKRLEGKCRMIFIHCICPEDVVRQRLAIRAKDPCAVSDGRWEVYLQQKKVFSSPAELGVESFVTLETTRSLADLLQILEKKISAIGAGFLFFPADGNK